MEESRLGSVVETVKSISWKVWLTTVVVLLPALFMGYFEYERYQAIYSLCNKDFIVYSNFTQESVCNGHPLSLQFASLGLVNCSKALEKKEDEKPNICALRNWYRTSWIHTVIKSVIGVWEQTTSVIMIVLVFPVSILIGYWIYKSEIEKTNRHALSMEQQGKPLEAMQEILARMPVGNNVVYLEDAETKPLRKRKSSLNLKKPKNALVVVDDDE